ncbi:MAG: ABC transporter permease [Mariprofundus sp.]|nr:ABC transporter permease [Mariprofundus sp.]
MYKYIPVALQSIQTRRLQSALSMLGIVIGVGAVIGAFSIIEGGRAEMLEKIRQLGANQLNIQNLDADEEKILAGQHNPSRGMSLSDVAYIQRELSQYISHIAPILKESRVLRYQAKSIEANVLGSSADLLALHKLELEKGRFISQRDVVDNKRVCVLGRGIRQRLFPFENALGQSIRIGDDWFRIIGLLKSRDSQQVREIPGEYYYNQKVFVPYSTMMLARNEASRIDRIDIAIQAKADIRTVAAGIDRILARLHHRMRDYKVTIPGDLLRHEQESKRVFNLILFWSAALSLIVGGVGIMNVMLATVMERTMEVGLRRALGASRLHIIQQFLTETVLLTLSGGVLGVVLGSIAALVISAALAWPVVISLQAVLLGLGISVLTGMVFGMYPAMRAAWLDPIQALRRE